MPSKTNIVNYFHRIQEYFRGLPRRGRIFALLAAALVIALAGWRIYSHMEERRLVKSPDEPAAVLLRDDAAKPREPALFLQAQSRLQENLRLDGEPRHVFMVELRLDEKACREYYGSQDGVAQCKNNWGLLAPGEKDWGVSPDLPGKWTFDSMPYKYSARFAFSPSEQSARTRYRFKLPSRLGKNVRMAEHEAFFTSSSFSLNIGEWAFLADPQNPRNLMLSGKITSTYPIDRESLKAALKLEASSDIKLGEPELVFAEDNLSLAVNVKVLSLPAENAPVRLALQKGVRRAVRKEQTADIISQGANVPGRDVFVSLDKVNNFIHTDDELNSRQMLVLEFTRPVKIKEAQESTVALMLPAYADKKDEQARRFSNWGSEENARLLREALQNSGSMERLQLTPVSGHEEYSRTVSFTYSAPGGRWFIAHNGGGAASLTDYKLAAFSRAMPARSFEPEARIMQKGTILSMNGAKKLALISRSVDTVKINAYRVRPEFINLLVSQTNKVITSPDFEYGNLQMEDISEHLELSYKPQKNSGHEPDYHALDLTPLLSGGGKGIFRLEINGYSKGRHLVKDVRFMLLTDLAVNLKQGRRGEREVFVSSFSGGAPLEGAQVQVIGRNGLPVFSKNAGTDGRVNIPSLEGLTRERRPIAVTVSLGRDLTFMALEDYTREVPLTGYPETAGRQADSRGVSAFVFSERGMFKPGEELRFGVLLKSSTWDSSVTEGLPVRMVLTNPRGTKVYDKQHRQDETGLIALAIPSQETDPTGLYSLGVYLDDRHLGYAQVQMEEFQPDNLKVNASFKDISPLRQQGWALPQSLSALVRVENLYGVPAVDNRVEASVSLAPARLAFSQYSDYRFFDPGTTEQSRNISLGAVNTNERGEAEFKLDLG
ncbi:MAG: hypothetical protein LBD82_03615, partial [Deltaproteobacteria bacterium]|nr:hypothetical protein [Deltaproteobacteria bacterium]